MNMRQDADRIIKAAIHAAQPDTAVQKALASLPPYTGRLLLVAIGKAGCGHHPHGLEDNTAIIAFMERCG